MKLLLLLVAPIMLLAAAKADDSASGFFHVYWYERNAEFNPHYERRFRVNAPEAVLHPQFGQRVETRENGLMLIRAEEDLRFVTGAELYLELWGGHPGTVNKRVSVNGRTTYKLPEVGTAAKNCTYSYPFIPLKTSDLVNGYNAFQFACDQGSTFWGHYIIDNAGLRVALTKSHPALRQNNLHEFVALLMMRSGSNRESFNFALNVPPPFRNAIASVDFQGFYEGYDENGNELTRDWHGFTKSRQPVAFIGSATRAPFSVDWNLAMLPAQRDMSVRAIVHFKSDTNLIYVTQPSSPLRAPEREKARVTIHRASDSPRPFWSRAGERKSCAIKLDMEPEQIERAELHVVTWTGGAGNVTNYFTLNGQFFPVAEGSRHEVQYSTLPVDPATLRKGVNRFELISDTEHHGIEVFLPGPALVVRTRDD